MMPAPGGRAGGADVVIGKSHAFGIKVIEVGRLDDVIAVTSKVAIALIIGNYEDYVGRRQSINSFIKCYSAVKL